MVEVALPIDLALQEKLKNREYRQRFFLAETSAQIAKQLVNLRKRRDKNQEEVAVMLETRQPAISRVESASYRNWSFNTLRRIAEALDARIRVTIEPFEDVIHEYEEDEQTCVTDDTHEAAEEAGAFDPSTPQGFTIYDFGVLNSAPLVLNNSVGAVPSNVLSTGTTIYHFSSPLRFTGSSFRILSPAKRMVRALRAKSRSLTRDNDRLKNEIARLKRELDASRAKTANLITALAGSQSTEPDLQALPMGYLAPREIQKLQEHGFPQ
jgi:transcriptional regulator with XRE-family HTH domain